MQTHDHLSTYVHLGLGPEIDVIDVTPTFWQTIDERIGPGRLVTGSSMTADWSHWEMHPEGGELIAVTAGRVRFHIDDGTDVSEITVTAPEFIVVPAGTWHTADRLGDALLLIVTWGEGTQHRPR